MPKYLTNTTFFSDNLGTYIANGHITTNQITTNGNIYLSGAIQNGSNFISFNEQYQFTDFNHNIHVYGTMLVDYNGTTYNVGAYIASGAGGGGGGYPSINYNSTTGETTFSGILIFPSNSISSASINNSDFITIATNQTITSSKTYTLQQFFQGNISLQGSILLNSGITLTNTQLSYLDGMTANIQTQISNRVSKTGNETIAGIKTFSSPIVSSGASITTNTIPITSVVGTAVDLGSYQIISGLKQFSTTPIITSNLRLDGNLSLGGATVTVSNAQLQRIPDIGTLNTKTTNITFATNTTSVSNTLSSSVFSFSSSINGFSSANFNTAIDYSRTLTSNSQDQHNATLAIATPALAGTTANTAALAVITTTTLPAMSGLIAANSADIATLEGDVTTLQQKTQTLSYSNATTVTSISGICNLSTLRLTNLESGFTQIENQPIIIIGTCEHRNGLSITNGFGLSVDGGIVQNNNSGNTFNGSVSCIRDFTTSGTNSNLNSSNIQIGTSTASALTINSTQTNNGDITIVAGKKLVIKNIVPLNLDDIYIGGETGAYTNYNTYFNTKVVINEPLTILANQQQGTALLRYSSTSYNDNFSVNATTTATITAPVVSIGTSLGVTTVFGSLICGNIYSLTGTITSAAAVYQF
jgi:hypothetical protein